jgi:hypothetical protein
MSRRQDAEFRRKHRRRRIFPAASRVWQNEVIGWSGPAGAAGPETPLVIVDIGLGAVGTDQFSRSDGLRGGAAQTQPEVRRIEILRT